MMKTLLFSVAATAAAALLAGCESATASAPPPKPATAAATPAPAVNLLKDAVILIPVSKVNALVPGMNTKDVMDLIGEPYDKKPFPPGGPQAEIWTYRIAMWERADQVPVAMQDVPAFDPMSNRQVTRQEPVYQIQHVRTYQTLELLMVDGRLIERKAGRDTDRAFY